MGSKQSKIVEKSNYGNLNLICSSPHREKYLNQCVPLHKAALKGDWDFAYNNILSKDMSLIRTHITEGGETALHIAAVEGHYDFVANLLDIMEEKDVGIQNAKGSTALCFVAAVGHLDIAKLMVEKFPNLATIRGGTNGVTPLFMAALQGFHDLADFLYPLSDFETWTLQDQITLLTTSIDSGLYGLAMKIVEDYRMLAVAEDGNGETPLEVLARKPSALYCTNHQRFWPTILNTMPSGLIPSCLKSESDNMNAECDAKTLLSRLWEIAVCEEDIEMGQVGNISKLFFVAAESGNDDVLVELIRGYPDFLYKVNGSKQSVFHIAVVHRYAKVFNLIYELRGIKDLIATYVDKEGNNILHLAAKLAPQSQLNCIPGPALQMQQEVLWFKEVEKLTRPSHRSMKNNARQTPDDLFLIEHEKLMKDGEKLMKQIAKSCMLVTMLIATVVFTTVFTVPGGYDNDTGAPILGDRKLFMVFPVSEAVATLASLTSMFMFLSILTCRYSVNDYLRTLPFWLLIGMAALFVSIVAMMMVFCSSLLFLEHGAAITVVLFFFASVPIMFIILKYPLLLAILRSTYSCTWLFGSNNRLFV